RFGALSGPRPDWLPREEADKLNNTSSILEAQGATFFNSLGIETTRSDRVAAGATAGVVLGAATGAVVAGVPARFSVPPLARSSARSREYRSWDRSARYGAHRRRGSRRGRWRRRRCGYRCCKWRRSRRAPGCCCRCRSRWRYRWCHRRRIRRRREHGRGTRTRPGTGPEAPAVESAPAPAPEPAPVIDLEPAAAFVAQNTQPAAQFADTATASSTGSAVLEQATDWAEQAAPAATPAVDQVQDAGAQAASWVAEQPGGNQLLEAGADLRTAMPNEVNTLLSTFENATALTRKGVVAVNRPSITPRKSTRHPAVIDTLGAAPTTATPGRRSTTASPGGRADLTAPAQHPTPPKRARKVALPGGKKTAVAAAVAIAAASAVGWSVLQPDEAATTTPAAPSAAALDELVTPAPTGVRGRTKPHSRQ
ncbi:hypothetical protein ACFQZ4_54680, partial [Catellatospora coxensis]